MHENLIEKMFTKRNMNIAYRKVKSSKCPIGIDNMTVDRAYKYAIVEGNDLLTAVVEGEYTPEAVRLACDTDDTSIVVGVPTVIDRLIQQCIVNEMSKLVGPILYEQSYESRQSKVVYSEMLIEKDNLKSDFNAILDMNLNSYISKLPQNKMMKLITVKVRDKKLLALIDKYLYNGVKEEGKIVYPETGVPQGGPLSDLTASVYLNALGKELTLRKIKYVRYGSRIKILCKSEMGGLRLLNNTLGYLEHEFKLN